MRGIIGLGFIVFMAAAGYWLVHDMSPETRSLITGLGFGLLALVVVCLMFLLVVRMLMQQIRNGSGMHSQQSQPPVTIIQVPSGSQLEPPRQQPQRQLPRWVDDDGTEYDREPQWHGFNIVGDGDFDDDDYEPLRRRQPPMGHSPVAGRSPVAEAQWREADTREADTRVTTAPAYQPMTFRDANPEVYKNGAMKQEGKVTKEPVIDLRTDDELVGEWLDAWCNAQTANYTDVSALHDSFCTWVLDETELDDVMDVAAFGRILSGMEIPKRRAAGGTQYRIVIDV